MADMLRETVSNAFYSMKTLNFVSLHFVDNGSIEDKSAQAQALACDETYCHCLNQ